MSVALEGKVVVVLFSGGYDSEKCALLVGPK